MSRRPAQSAVKEEPFIPFKSDQVNSCSVGVIDNAARSFDNLTPLQRKVATLGVHPDAMRPLKDLNDAHYQVLRNANALSPDLDAKIRAYQHMSSLEAS